MSLMKRLFEPNISKLESKGEVGKLIAVLESDASAELRTEAIAALGRLGGDEAVTAAVAALTSGDAELAPAAEPAVAAQGPRAIPALVEALGAPGGDRALAALLALDTAALEPLATAAGEGEEPARLRAMHGLVELGRRQPETGDDQTGQDNQAGETVFRALLAALGDRSPACRVLAASSLAALADPRASRALAAQLKDGDEAVRDACRSALAGIGEPAAPDLADALGDRNANSRRLAAGLLGEICSAPAEPATDTLRQALDALTDRVRDPDAGARQAVAEALQRVDRDNLERLVASRLELLAHPELGEPDEPLELLRRLLAHVPMPPDRIEAVTRQVEALGFTVEEPDDA